MATPAVAEIDRLPLPSAGTLLLWLQLPLLLLVLYGAYDWLVKWMDQPLQNIEVQGRLDYSDRKALRLAVWQQSSGSYMELDLAKIKGVLEQQPWVYQVSVRRQWPAALTIDVVEQQPVARWGQNGLLNSNAEVFVPAHVNGFETLPLMTGPESRALEMMRQFRTMTEVLRPLQLKVTELALAPRGAWSLRFDNGIELLLGRGNTLEKLRRFSKVYAGQLMAHQDKIDKVDARYTNGLSVSWKAEAEATGKSQ